MRMCLCVCKCLLVRVHTCHARAHTHIYTHIYIYIYIYLHQLREVIRITTISEQSCVNFYIYATLWHLRPEIVDINKRNVM